jgi:ATP-independent RNA helicase DbpA
MRRVDNIAKEIGTEVEWHPIAELAATGDEPLLPPMVTLQILGGRKEKIRPGDVLGALTGEAGFSSAQVGKINITEFHTYVAVAREIAQQAERWLASGKIKGKTVKVRIMSVEDDAQDTPSRANASRNRRPPP